MNHFIFKAKKPTGEVYNGQLDAADRYELYRLIRDTGDEIISVQERNIRNKSSGGTSIFNKISTPDKINFARNLGSMITAGLALSRALSVLQRQARTATLRELIADIIANVDKGVTLSDSLGQHPKVFSPLFISMVRAGEQGGSLADSLKVIATQMENSYLLTKRVRGALIYPAVILLLMVGIAILMFTYVIPTLMKTFIDLHVTLPWTTQILLNISNVVRGDGLWLIIGFVVVGYGYYRWSHSPGGKSIIDSLLLKIPIIGNLIKEVNTARAARTLSSLLQSGVEVVESIKITALVVQNVHFRAVLLKASDAIGKGGLLSKVFAGYTDLYPVFLVEMMSVGEESGKMSEMLMGVAQYYEDDIAQKTKDMSTVIEPFIMIFIAAGVGFFAVAMISPMYSLVNAI